MVTAAGTSHVHGVVIDGALRWQELHVVKHSPLALVTEVAPDIVESPASHPPGGAHMAQRKHLLPAA